MKKTHILVSSLLMAVTAASCHSARTEKTLDEGVSHFSHSYRMEILDTIFARSRLSLDSPEIIIRFPGADTAADTTATQHVPLHAESSAVSRLISPGIPRCTHPASIHIRARTMTLDAATRRDTTLGVTRSDSTRTYRTTRSDTVTAPSRHGPGRLIWLLLIGAALCLLLRPRK